MREARFTGKLIWDQDQREWNLLTVTGVKDINDLLDPFEDMLIHVHIHGQPVEATAGMKGAPE